MAELTLKNVTKSFGNVKVIHGVDLFIEDGEFTVFVGPSGCGKSTLLRMISGLESVTDGEIEIGGECVNDVEPGKRGVAMVFQSYALYPHMTARENLTFGLESIKTPPEEIAKRVEKASKILQIESLMDRKPSQLSGGQRQRVAIGRAIVREPKVFLFDEPLSNLDAELRAQMRMELHQLHREMGSTMIYVTHDQVEAMTLADKIVLLHDGIIEQVGSPLELFNKPCNRFVAGFLGSPQMNFLPAQPDAETQSVRVANSGRVQMPGLSADKIKKIVTIGIRPDDLELVEASDEDSIAVTVKYTEQLGGETVIYSSTKTATEHEMVAKCPGQLKLQQGTVVGFKFDVAKVHLFDASDNSIAHRFSQTTTTLGSSTNGKV